MGYAFFLSDPISRFSSAIKLSRSANWRYTEANRIYATSSTCFSSLSTSSPICTLETSWTRELRISRSTRLTISSSCCRVTIRLLQARRRPFNILLRSNNSRLPFFFITISGTSSTISYVVKRRPHFRHYRRRRIAFPSSVARESVTFVSSPLQNGHLIIRSSQEYITTD